MYLLHSSSLWPSGTEAHGHRWWPSHASKCLSLPWPLTQLIRWQTWQLARKPASLNQKAKAWWFFLITRWRLQRENLLSPLGDSAADPCIGDRGFVWQQQCRFLPEIPSVLRSPEVTKSHCARPARSPRLCAGSNLVGWKAYKVPCPESYISSIHEPNWGGTHPTPGSRLGRSYTHNPWMAETSRGLQQNTAYNAD